MRDWDLSEKYNEGFAVDEFLPFKTMGMITKRDEFTIKLDRDEIWQTVKALSQTPDDQLHQTFGLPKDSDWTASNAKSDVLRTGPDPALVRPVMYAPFDFRYTYYTGETRGFHARPVRQMMTHFDKENFALSVIRKMDISAGWAHSFCIAGLMTHHGVSQKEGNYILPLYLYPAEDELDQLRRINFDEKLYAKLRKLAKHAEYGEPDEVAVFNYIYGVLHCPVYREAYSEFLKLDFPRIPWPTSSALFWDVSDKGGELRRLHLMEADAIGDTPFPFIGEGDSMIANPRFEDGRVWVNDTQYFDAAPPVSWDFYIGGYQPAQKWLKDRKGRTLNFDDVKHYQRILKILSETDRIMKTIEMPLAAHQEG